VQKSSSLSGSLQTPLSQKDFLLSVPKTLQESVAIHAPLLSTQSLGPQHAIVSVPQFPLSVSSSQIVTNSPGSSPQHRLLPAVPPIPNLNCPEVGSPCVGSVQLVDSQNATLLSGSCHIPWLQND
jgi:hypothetical protein